MSQTRFRLLETAGLALAENSADFEAWLGRGLAAYREVRYQDGVDALKRAVDLHPHDVGAHILLGKAHVK